MATKREIIGHHIEDMPTTMDYQVSPITTVIGTSAAPVTTGNPTTDISPIKVSSEHKFSQRLQNIIILLQELSDVEEMFTCVYSNISYDSTGSANEFDPTKLLAYREKASVLPTTAAGGNEALQNSATLHWTKIREYGTTDMTTSTPTFVPIAGKPKEKNMHYADGIAARKDFAIFWEYEE